MAHTPQFDHLALTRRELLQRCGMGFGAMALGSMLAPAAAAGGEIANPLLPKAAHFPAKAKHVIHLFMNGGPSHVDTFDHKPALAKYAGQPLPMENLTTERKTGAALPSAVQVSQVRPERHRGERAVCEHGPLDRRHRGDPLDARRSAEPRAVAAADELRRRAADPPQPGLVGLLRPRHRESEPAGVRCDVPRRLSDSGDAELAIGFLARHLRGSVSRHAALGSRAAHRKHPQREHPASAAARAARSAGEAQPAAPAGAAGRRGAGGADPVVRARLPHADRGGRGVRREPRAAAYSRHVRRRAAGAADAHRPPAGRAGRAVRAGVARRRAAVGHARRHRSAIAATWRGSATRRSAPC